MTLQLAEGHCQRYTRQWCQASGFTYLCWIFIPFFPSSIASPRFSLTRNVSYCCTQRGQCCNRSSTAWMIHMGGSVLPDQVSPEEMGFSGGPSPSTCPDYRLKHQCWIFSSALLCPIEHQKPSAYLSPEKALHAFFHPSIIYSANSAPSVTFKSLLH